MLLYLFTHSEKKNINEILRLRRKSKRAVGE